MAVKEQEICFCLCAWHGAENKQTWHDLGLRHEIENTLITILITVAASE